jgi:hypothetical protein
MQALDLNLATRPFRNNTLLWVGYCLAVVLLGTFTTWNVLTYREYKANLRELRADIDSFDLEQQQLEVRERRAQNGIEKFDLVSLDVRADKANEVIEWKAFSWTRLFNRLTEIMPYDVKLVEIRPIFQLSRVERSDAIDVRPDGAVPVLVEGVSKNFDAIFEFQNVLLESRYFGRVEPGKLRRTDDKRELIFEMRFQYFQDAAEQPAAETLDAVEAIDAGADPGAASEPVVAAGSQIEGPPIDGEPVAVDEPDPEDAEPDVSGEADGAPAEPGGTAPASAEEQLAPGTAADPPGQPEVTRPDAKQEAQR